MALSPSPPPYTTPGPINKRQKARAIRKRDGTPGADAKYTKVTANARDARAMTVGTAVTLGCFLGGLGGVHLPLHGGALIQQIRTSPLLARPTAGACNNTQKTPMNNHESIERSVDTMVATVMLKLFVCFPETFDTCAKQTKQFRVECTECQQSPPSKSLPFAPHSART